MIPTAVEMRMITVTSGADGDATKMAMHIAEMMKMDASHGMTQTIYASKMSYDDPARGRVLDLFRGLGYSASAWRMEGGDTQFDIKWGPG